ncbi:MAG: hypothetical protein V1763_01260 [Parcubacteria group bacterium]
MKQRIKTLIIATTIFIASSVANGSNAAGQALLLLEPTDQTVSVGDYFTIDVAVDPHGATVDTVRANISFSADKLQAVSFSLSDAFPTTAPGNFIDNEKGALSEGGAILGGSIKDKSVFGTITFQAVARGSASVAAVKGSRLIRSGKESINQYLGKAMVSIGPAPANVAEQIVVQSATHPDSSKWYSVDNVNLSWSVSPNLPKIEKFLFAFDQNPNTDPAMNLPVTASSKVFNKVNDGIWYFHVKGQYNQKSFSKTNHFRVMIDMTLPSKISPVMEKSIINEGESAVVRFDTTDAGSGIDHYELAVDDGQFVVHESPTVIDGLKPGKHLIMVRAVDKAGNVSANGVYVVVNSAIEKKTSLNFVKWWYSAIAGAVIIVGALMWITLRKKSHQLK